jgi:hypothetical protein
MRPLAVLSLLTLGGCASRAPKAAPVDLEPARRAVEAAREAGAPERATETLARAEGHLREAEALAEDGHGDVREASALARLTVAEAECAATLATARPIAECPAVDAPATSLEQGLQERLARAEDERLRLEERVSLLLKELELTETEVIRTKAKLKGQTKAEASSAIAETRILLRRLTDQGVRSPHLARCEQLLQRAETLIDEENYGGAAFLAITAQDLLEQTRRLAVDRAALDTPAPRARYVVGAEIANIRRGPSTTEPVIGQATRGTTLPATVVRGDWVRVSTGTVTGWIYRPLLR